MRNGLGRFLSGINEVEIDSLQDGPMTLKELLRTAWRQFRIAVSELGLNDDKLN